MGRIKAYKGRIIALAILSIILPLIVLLVMIIRFENMASKGMMAELDQMAIDRVTNLAGDIYALCDASYRDTRARAERGAVILRDRLKNGDYVTVGQIMVGWEVENPYTNKAETLNLPQMMMGNTWLGQNTAANKAMIPAFDDLRRLTGGHIAVFQKIDAEGNMLAVASSALNAAGNRDIGVYVPARDAGGAMNLLTKNILAGESFQTMEMVDDDWYLAYYEPIKDRDGLILGMLSYRGKWNAADLLKGFFASRRIGRQGEVSLIAVQGKDQGRYIVSEGHSLFGKNAWEARDTKERIIIPSLAQDVMKQPPGQIVSDSYWVSVQNAVRKNIVAAAYFENYSGLIFVRTIEDDFYSPLMGINNLMPRFMTEIAVAGSLLFLLFVLMAAFLERKVTAAFRFLADLANALVKGDAKHAKRTLEQEWTASIKKKKGFSREIRESLDAFQILIRRMGMLSFPSGQEEKREQEPKKPEKPEESKILTLSVPVEEAMDQQPPFPLAAVQEDDQEQQQEERQSSDQEEMPPAPGEVQPAPEETQLALEEQTRKMEEFSREIDQMQSRLSQTMEAATSGRKNLEEIEGNMRNLVQSTTHLSDQFHGIQDKTQLLSDDIKKMADIAEQTNVLSLNVYLEAGKGGQSPLRLSEGIYDVGVLSGGGEKMAQGLDGQVNDLQDTMVSSLQGQEALGTEIRRNVEKIADIRNELDMIIDHLQGYDLKIHALLEGINSRSHGEEGKAVNEAMVSLSGESGRMRNCIRQFGSSMDELMQAVDQLQGDSGEENKGIITNFKTVVREIRHMAQETGTAVQDVAKRVKELQGGMSADAETGMKGDRDVYDRLERVMQVTDRLYQIIDHLRSYNFHLGDLQQVLSRETPEGTRVFTAITGLSNAAAAAKDSLHDFRKATELLVRHIGAQQDTSSPETVNRESGAEMRTESHSVV